MKGDRVATGLLIALVGGLVVAGLVLVGGPGTAQKVRRDETRAEDLVSLAHCLESDRDDLKVGLPLVLDATARCAGVVRITDPHTGEAYRYQRRSDREFTVCATFEVPGRDYPTWGFAFDPKTGCLSEN